MSVNLIATEDANALTTKFKTSLQPTVVNILTFSPISFLKTETTKNLNSVCVIFLTPLSWREIQRFNTNDVKKLFADPTNTVILWSCSETVKSGATELFAQTVEDWKTVSLYEAAGEEWYNADAKIRYRLSKLENGEAKIPSASKYIIRPDTITTPLSHCHAEVLVILVEAENSSDLEKLHIKVNDKLVDTKKIVSNVWSFCASDFSPGEYKVHVIADDEDLGSNILHVKDLYVTLEHEIRELKQEDPKRFLAEFLKLNIQDFDRDLEDYISGSSCVSVIEKLLHYGDKDESEFPTFLHFCSKYGNELCVKWCKKNDPNFKEACVFENKAGKTPEQLAMETQQKQSLIEMLRTKDQESEELVPMKSPFENSAGFLRSSYPGRDSGCSSSNCSGDSVGFTNLNTTKTRFKFERGEHPYDTINDGQDAKTAIYNRPWENKTIIANRSAQVWSTGTISESLAETTGKKSAALSRSNTTGSVEYSLSTMYGPYNTKGLNKYISTYGINGFTKALNTRP